MSAQETQEQEALVQKKGLRSIIKAWIGKTNSKSASHAPVIADITSPGPCEAAPAEVADTPASLEVPRPSEEEVPDMAKVMLSQVNAERAKRLGDRFNIPIEDAWTVARADKTLNRVNKPIRMRVHRNCHRCNTSFGSSKTCPACEHRTCTKCPRYPPRNDHAVKSTDTEPSFAAKSMAVVIEVDDCFSLTDTIVLTMPSKTGGQPLVRKSLRQRVRRTCHECSALFVGGSKVCSNCQHVRCTDCPRDPAKKNKYPDGYPGDQFSVTSTSPIKYACHKCTKIYPPVPHPNTREDLGLADTEVLLECTRCGHQRCTSCQRARPRKVEPEPDPEIMKSFQERIAAWRLELLDTPS